MAIAAGQLAPDFSGTTWKGEDIDIEAFRGKKVWLAFHRYASCPLCNLRIKEVIQRHKEFEDAGIQVIAVFQSSPETIAKHVGRQNPPFPLVLRPRAAALRAVPGREELVGRALPAGLHPGRSPP